LPGARSAPGGQLVQATDGYMATRGARVVVVDDDGVRAPMTASWLKQMGWREVAVLDGGLGDGPLETGEHVPYVPGLAEVAAAAVTPEALAARLRDDGTLVIDLATSLRYRDGHVPGAWFAIRARLDDALRRLPPARSLVLTSEDDVVARLAAPELAALVGRPVAVLAGGTAAWAAAGLPLTEGLDNLAAECDDVWYRPYERIDGVEQAMQAYLDWEVALVPQVDRDGTLRFRSAPP
jgi:rhodanese-related sulfurtransferase